MLTVEIDAIHDIMYLQVSQGLSARTVEFEPGTMIDLDDNGEVIGIEVLGLSRAVPLTAIFTRFPLDASLQAQIRQLMPSGTAVVQPTPARTVPEWTYAQEPAAVAC